MDGISSRYNLVYPKQHYNRGIKTVSVGSGADTLVKRMKTQLWDSVVNIILVEGKDMTFKDESTSDIHVRFKLASEKYKSKVPYEHVSCVLSN